MAETGEPTYDYVCFGDLAYEFDFSDLKEAEQKIKRKLKYYGLGKYDQERIEYVRKLKNDLFREIGLQSKSKFFNPSKSNFAEFTDFDSEKMKKDYLDRYDKISDSDMSRILNFAIYLYHMR
ncbi:MAG: hypothetical protein NXH86_03040 [Flavobacteriaceae bacterium]|jgi:hypothetical protein|uniref:Uncharacterized protein n=1 Tax=Flagellimonas olearia TaxID=552546 RepID=A0A444VKA8_9FLAO|nr:MULTISPECIES: hypothetical protein [Allomuricauda]MCR9263103.1 hypothetical protein [Flavobacteriaceae bacterium]RYC51208.1 hypothetical protein DN53_13440 [Allomuricauda olearia]